MRLHKVEDAKWSDEENPPRYSSEKEGKMTKEAEIDWYTRPQSFRTKIKYWAPRKKQSPIYLLWQIRHPHQEKPLQEFFTELWENYRFFYGKEDAPAPRHDSSSGLTFSHKWYFRNMLFAESRAHRNLVLSLICHAALAEHRLYEHLYPEGGVPFEDFRFTYWSRCQESLGRPVTRAPKPFSRNYFFSGYFDFMVDEAKFVCDGVKIWRDKWYDTCLHPAYRLYRYRVADGKKSFSQYDTELFVEYLRLGRRMSMIGSDAERSDYRWFLIEKLEKTCKEEEASLALIRQASAMERLYGTKSAAALSALIHPNGK